MNRTSRLVRSRMTVLFLLAMLPALVLVLGPSMSSDLGQFLQTLAWRLGNDIHSRATPATADDRVVVLGIDDATLNLTSAFPEDIDNSETLQLIQKGWPFSRKVYADTLQKLFDAGVQAVFLDVMFTGPSGEHPEGDSAFQEVLKRYPGRVLLGASFTETLSMNGMVTALQLPWNGFAEQADPPPNHVGYINVWPDADQIVRSIRFHRSMRNEDAGRYELAHLDQMHSIATAVAKAIGRGDLIPSGDARHFVRFGPVNAYPPVSLHEIFVPDLWQNNYQSGAVFKDKVVFIGNVTPHAQDFHVTPVGRMSGVQLHAHILAAALLNQFLTPLPGWLHNVAIFACAALAWMIVGFLHRPLMTLCLLAAGSLMLIFASQLLFEYGNVMAASSTWVLSFATSGLLGLTYDFVLERRQRKQLRGYLERYFSPDVVALMLREPEQFRALQRGAHRTITVLFSDLRGFTTLSETMAPQQVVRQLNQYFNRMVEIIHGHTGGIDKFIGDAIMAVWGWVGTKNTSETIQADAFAAVKTVVKMREVMVELNEHWRSEGNVELQFGVGIHCGEALVGDLGSDRQSGFTVMGDTVNTASRLEGITKEYGVDNIISDTVWNLVRERFLCRSADLVRPKGKLVPVPVFTVLKEGTMSHPQGLPEYEEGVRLYRAGDFETARARFVQAIEQGLNDHLSNMYLQRCEALLEAPPTEWDGVFVMTRK